MTHIKADAVTYPLVERRSGIDRRRDNGSLSGKYLWKGQRGTPRRKADRKKDYRVDRYDSKIVLAVFSILLLSFLDAALTLYLIHRGAAELNPVMNFFLQMGPMPFFVVKYLLTCLPLLLILSTRNAFLFNTRLRSYHLILFFVVPFAVVVFWEIYLIVWVLP
jgi:hypothetical protein